jgi:glycosyltransferase involved in cell wall biosynthesis
MNHSESLSARNADDLLELLSTLRIGRETDWAPEHLSPSAWLAHVPLAYWLVKVMQPGTIVELGTHTGASYFAFCQAVERLHLPTRCYAVDTWQGDPHAGAYDNSVFESVARVNDQQYVSFSSLLRTTFDEAVSGFADGEIDLLHIDGLHTYEAVSHDFATWRAKLSDRAVVLFHDTNVRDRGFGVWRFWQELREQFPSFEFTHGYGLGVLGVGRDLPPELSQLFAASTADLHATTIKGYFAARGESVRTRFLLADAERRASQAGSQLAAAQSQAAALLESEQRAQKAAEEIREENSHYQLQLEQLNARIRSAEEEREALRASVSDLKSMEYSLRTSTSWRITKPLRALSMLVSGGPLHPISTMDRIIPTRGPAALRLRMAASRTARKIGLGSTIDRMRRGTVAPSPPLLSSMATTALEADAAAIWIGGEPNTPGYRYRVIHWANAARAAGIPVINLRLDEVPSNIAAIRRARIIIIWRAPWDSTVAQVVELARSNGAILVFDVDDLMFQPELARIDVIDGIRSQSLTEHSVRDFYARVQRTMAAADICTATTEELAEQLRLLWKPAFVLPNGFDEQTFMVSRLAARRKASSPPEDVFRIGYAGGSRTHQRDFQVCANAIAEILRRRPNCQLVLFRDAKTDQRLVDLAEYPAFSDLMGQVEYRDLVPLASLPNEIARFDVNLAPLEVGNLFCEAKSELKYFEAALAGVCTIASPTGPYRRAIKDNVTGILALEEADWYNAISRLADDEGLRTRLARAALYDVLWKYGSDRRAELARFAFEQFQRGRAAARSFALELRRQESAAASRIEIPASTTIFASDRLDAAAVTVVIPLHNYEQYIVEALQSVAAQTEPCLDLIVVDDCSTDDSLAVALEWAKRNTARFNRLLVLQTAANAKLGPTRNVGFDAAETPYVLPLDADNRLLPECVQRCLAAIRQHAATYAYPIIRQFGADNQTMGNLPYDPTRFIGGNFIDAMALISKAAWCAAGGYRNIRFGWEDYDLWCRFAEMGLLGTEVGGKPAAEYRVHKSSMLRTTTEVSGNKELLVADIEARHRWLSITRPQEAQPPAAPRTRKPAPIPSSGGERLDRLIHLLRCPETGKPLQRAGDDALVTSDGTRRWPLVAGRPVFFPEIGLPEVRPPDHVSNAVPQEVLDLVHATDGFVLNVSAGGTAERPDNVIEAEVSIFRHTDLVADVHRLPFADASLSGVVSLNAFEHYHDPRQAALEIQRVLKPGGWVFIRTAFLQPEHEAPWHFYNCTKHGLLRWFEGFDTERLHVSDNFNPSYTLSWIASEAEQALARDVSAEAAEAFKNAPVGSLVTYWREESSRTSPVWQSFRQLSQRSQEVIGAGFEFVGRRPRD